MHLLVPELLFKLYFNLGAFKMESFHAGWLPQTQFPWAEGNHCSLGSAAPTVAPTKLLLFSPRVPRGLVPVHLARHPSAHS